MAPGSALTIPGKIHKVGLELPAKMTCEEWEDTGRLLTQISGSARWWLGDWLNFGESAYGEKYSQALDALDYENGSLRNAAWTCNSIELERRVESLTFSHHVLVAPLEPKDQDRWLKKAAKGGWTVADLRAQLMVENPDKRDPHIFIEGEEVKLRGHTFTVEEAVPGSRLVLNEVAF